MKKDEVNERPLEIYVNGEFLSSYGNASCQKVLCLGDFEKGDKVEIDVRATDGKGLPGNPVVVTEITE